MMTLMCIYTSFTCLFLFAKPWWTHTKWQQCGNVINTGLLLNGVCNHRFSDINVTYEKTLAHEKFTIDEPRFSTIYLDLMLFYPCLNLIQRAERTAEKKGHMCKYEVLKFWVCLMSKTTWFPLYVEVSAQVKIVSVKQFKILNVILHFILIILVNYLLWMY